MIRKDQCVRDYDILSPASSKYYKFSYIFWCQGLTATSSVSLGFSQRSGRLTHKRHQLWSCHRRTLLL